MARNKGRNAGSDGKVDEREPIDAADVFGGIGTVSTAIASAFGGAQPAAPAPAAPSLVPYVVGGLLLAGGALLLLRK